MSNFLRQQLVQMDANNLLMPTVVLLGTCEPIITGTIAINEFFWPTIAMHKTEANLKCCTQDEASKAQE
jgi:hypothetical protein